MLKHPGAHVAIAGLGLLSATAATTAEPESACATHYRVEGSFLSGKIFSTWADYAGMTRADVYARIYSRLARDGWNIVSADRDSGIISASQTVSFGNGATAPLTIVVESVATSGTKATATFRIGMGQATRGDTVKTKLCNYLDVAG